MRHGRRLRTAGFGAMLALSHVASAEAWYQPAGGASPINQSPTAQAAQPSLASVDGVPYVAWTEPDGTNSEVRVSKLNAAGTAWTQVGGGASPINQDPSKDAFNVSLASIGGVAYVAWTESDGVNNEIRVSKLNAAGTAWTQVVGGASPINQDPSRSADAPSLASIGGVPYVAWSELDGASFEIRVSKLDGGAWTQLEVGESPINQDSNRAARDPSLASVGGVPYVAWTEHDGTNYEVRVSKFDAGAWTQVEGGASPINEDPGKDGLLPSLASVAGVPYVAWSEQYGLGPTKIRVSKMNEAGTAWTQVVGGADPFNTFTFSGFEPSLASIGGVPYVAFSEGGGGNDEIMVYRLSDDGTVWLQIAPPGSELSPINQDPAQDGRFPSLAVVGDTPHVAWQEFDGTNTEIRVSRTIDTSITSGPAGPTNQTTPTFTFTASPPAGATFVCAVDLATPTPCTSPLTTPALADGPHTFTAAATSPTGGTDPSPAVRTFFVDTVAPQSSILLSGEASGSLYLGTVDVSSSAVDPEPSGGIATVRCELDPRLEPATFDDLPVGNCATSTSTAGDHIVYAAAADLAGNVEAPLVTRTFTNLPSPETTISSGPSGPTWATASAFGFASDIGGSTFECRVDGGGFAACGSPYLSAALKSGAHSFEVRARSPDGVVDPTPARRDFSVNELERHGYTCELHPFLGLGLTNSEPDGCGVYNRFKCEILYAECDPIPETCPAGATCTLTVEMSWFDVDPGINWRAIAWAEFLETNTRANASIRYDCLTGLGGDRCFPTATASVFGRDDHPRGACSALRENGNAFGHGTSRRLECKIVLEIKPTPPLTTIASGRTSIGIFAPGAGTLGISAAAGHGKAAAAKPVIAPQTKTVSEAGPATFKLKLSKQAKKTLKRKKKLKLKLDVAFTPAGGDAITSIQKVTLSKR